MENKYFALIIEQSSVSRVWTDNQGILDILRTGRFQIIRPTTSQTAHISLEGELVWIDVLERGVGNVIETPMGTGNQYLKS